MRLSSDCHSFALLALTLFGSSFTSALLVDSKAAAPLRPRLDTHYSKSKTKCSGKGTGTISLAAAGMTAGTSAYGTASASAGLGSSANNGSALASTLPYARTSKKKGKCKATMTTSVGSQQTGSAGTSNSPGQQIPGGPDYNNNKNNNSPGQSSAPADSDAPQKDTGSQIPASGNDNSSPSATNSGLGTQPSQTAGSGNESSLAGAGSGVPCGPQSTVTITSQNTVTVTAAATATNLNGALSNSGIPDSYAPMAANSNAHAAASSVSRKQKTKCTGGPKHLATGTAASTGFLPSGTGSPYGGKNVTVPAGTGLKSKKARRSRL